MSAEIDLRLLEEFDRLGEVADRHELLCTCEACTRFMELGDLIRALRAKQKAAGVSG